MHPDFNSLAIEDRRKLLSYLLQDDAILPESQRKAIFEALEKPLRRDVEENNNPSSLVPLDLSLLATEPPKPIDWVVTHCIPAGVVGILAGPGGAGKSYFSLNLAAWVASGLVGAPLEVPRAQPVVVVNVEDPPDELARRVYKLLMKYPNILDVLRKNLYIFPAQGIIGSLARYGSYGNPEPSDNFKMLEEIIVDKKPRLVILDTFSRLYGLSENSNEEVAYWLSLLEGLCRRNKTSFLVVHHLNKSDANSLSRVRGASALVNNARFVWVLEPLSDEEKQKFNLEVDSKFFRLVFEKCNYNPTSEPIIFRIDNGIIKEENIGKRKRAVFIEALTKALKITFPDGASLRDLAKNKDFRGLIREITGEPATKLLAQLEDLLEDAVNAGFLDKRKVAPSRGKPKIIYTAKQK